MSRLLILLTIVIWPEATFGQNWFSSGRQNTTFFASYSSFDRSVAGSRDALAADQPDTLISNTSNSWSQLCGLYPGCGLEQLLGAPNSLPDIELTQLSRPIYGFDPAGSMVVRGQSPSDGGGGGESGGGGAGAAAATDPSVPLTQLQLQNIFTPESYDASGYANTFIVQPVLPFTIGEDSFFPYHIMRPTIPIIAPTADPDGSRGVQGGLGDTTIVDAYFRPLEKLKTNVGVGYVATLPTRTHPALGRGEWQLGPSVAVLSRAIPKWIVGGLVEVPFSLSSDAYQVQMQAVALRLLPDEWFIGWGDQILKFDDQNGGYDIPLSMQFGKVVKFGETPMKLFVEPIYTPPGLRSGPGGAQYGIKLNLTFLLPGTKLDAPLLSRLGGHGGTH